MKIRSLIMPASLVAAAMTVNAQSAIDAYNLTRSDLRGTARYMSMAGAFGALGGDLSSLNQNPAGIGVYRGSEIGLTLDLDIMSSKTGSGDTDDMTKFYCNNFGYIGTIQTGNSIAPTFSWGASYSRVASFNRRYRGSIGELNTSLSNYIANYTTAEGPTTATLNGYDNGYNPYFDSNADWLSILAYNTYMINPIGNSDNEYNGLWQKGSSGNAEFDVVEKGHIDEYDINFGGNIANLVYYGIGFGIFDLDYTQSAFYDEQIFDGRVPNKNATGTETGTGYYSLSNYKHISGTGFNFKIGAILKPINEFRIGLAVHTPTWYSLSSDFDASTQYSFSTFGQGYGEFDTPFDGYNWRLKTPWRLIGSVAGVIGGRAILSMDYEYDAYNDMTVGDSRGAFDLVTEDIKAYNRGSSTLSIGAEYRVTPSFSIRAGYRYKDSDVIPEARNQDLQIYTAGTQPAYAFDNKDQYITLGLGFRTGGFYIDAAYVHRNRQSTYHAFTPYGNLAGDWVYAPETKLTTNHNNIVLSLGYKF